MRWLIGCEFSGIVREAFRKRGHDAWSCDLLDAEDGSPFHLKCDVLTVINDGWDAAIFHPECTFLCNSGVKWLYKNGQKQNGPDPDRWRKMWAGAAFFKACQQAPMKKIAVENPVMHEHAAAIIGSRADQFIQPWQHGHGEIKATGLHLKNLPLIKPTKIVDGRQPRVHFASPGPDRWKERSRTLPGIAAAFAEQWG